MVNYKWLSRSFHGIGAPQVEQLSGARDGQSDEGAPARPMHHLAVKRGVWAGERRRARIRGLGKPERPD
jgi:hypothetical protein